MPAANPYAPPAANAGTDEQGSAVEAERRQFLRTEGFIRGVAILAFALAHVSVMHLFISVRSRTAGVFDMSISEDVEALGSSAPFAYSVSDGLRVLGILALALGGAFLWRLHRAGGVFLALNFIAMALASVLPDLRIFGMLSGMEGFLNEVSQVSQGALLITTVALLFGKPRAVLHSGYRLRVIAATPHIKSPIALWAWLSLPIVLLASIGPVRYLFW